VVKKSAKPKEPKPPKPAPLEKRCLETEDPRGALPERDLCGKCGLLNAKTPPLWNKVPTDWTRRLLVVYEQPLGAKDALLVQSWLAAQGFNRSDVAYTHAVRCGKKGDPNITQIRCCRPFLLWDVGNLAPETVLAFGNVALAALTDDGAATVTRSRGRLLEIPTGASNTSDIIPHL
jgi:uracil-DNA glycosylase